MSGTWRETKSAGETPWKIATLVFRHRVQYSGADDGLLAERARSRRDPALVYDGDIDAHVVAKETQRPGVFESRSPEDAQEVGVRCAPEGSGESEESRLALAQHLLELGDREDLGEDLW
jgi:hypothetical protein